VSNLEPLVERIRAELARKNQARDLALERSRVLIRYCANSIRATHRHEFALAEHLLGEARTAAAAMCTDARVYADVFYAGYVQDALKELAESAIILAVVRGESCPEPEALGVEYPAYLNGLGEAMGEARRAALDALRCGQVAEAERLLGVMDDVLSYLVTIDYPDALTGNLRRTTDMVRGVTERTRGDLTTVLCEERLQTALQVLSQRMNAR
jgi:translin